MTMRWLAPLAIVLALIGAWELAARWDVLADALSIEPFLIPAPSDIAEALWEDRELLADDAWVTLREIVLGFALAVVAGVAVRGPASPLARRCAAPSTPCSSPRRRSRSSSSRRSSSSGSGSGSAPSWRSSR